MPTSISGAISPILRRQQGGLEVSVASQTTEKASRALGREVKRGAAWTLMGRGLIFCISFAASVVLARLLDPSDFGVFGIAIIFTGLATRFGNIGFGLALIQRPNIRQEHISSLFVVNFLIFSTLMVVLIVLSPRIGQLFDNPLVGQVLAVAALMFLAKPFSSVARALMQRQMNFKVPAMANIVDHLSAALISVACAIGGLGVWSLVYGQLGGAISSTLVLMGFARWRPRLRYHHGAMKELYSFGLPMLAKNLLIYISDKVDYFIIGKRLGAAPLGFYEKAFNLMDLLVKELVRKINIVLFSAFSRIQNDHSKFYQAYQKVILTLSLVYFPFFFGLFLVAPSFIRVLFGDKWIPSVVPLQILCVAGLLRMHLQVTSTMVNAMGEVAAEASRRALAFVLLATGCWFGSAWGLEGVTVAVTGTTGILAVMMGSYFCRFTGLTWLDLLRPLGPAFTASVVMSVALLAYREGVARLLPRGSLAMLVSSIGIGVVAYASVLLLLRPSPVQALLREFLGDMRLLKRQSAGGGEPSERGET